MTKHPSLAQRLSTHLLALLLLGSIAISLSYMVLSLTGIGGLPPMALNDLAEGPARAQVLKSITRAADGSLIIEPSAALRAQVERTPTFLYAAYDPVTGIALPGSSAKLVAALGDFHQSHINAGGANFSMDGDEKTGLFGQWNKVETPFGWMIVAIYGYTFEPANLRDLLLDSLKGLLYWSGPLFAFAAFLIWFGVRRGLAPLNDAARDASRIDMDSLNQRFPENTMPIEVLPFVKAVNEALTRLDAGVASQGRFTANAAHELRTPIAILDARADAIEDVPLKREMKRDVRRMQTVVNQLLLLARRSSSEKDRAPPIDLAEAVQSIAGNYLPIAISNARRLELDAPTAPVMARMGCWELECVVGNLIENALRAEPQGGSVLIRVGADRVIEVVDHGEGVAPEDRELIFEPFWRKSDAPQGTGLGLAIVKEIVEMHNGRISAEETPGGGATFRVTLQRIDGDQPTKS